MKYKDMVQMWHDYNEKWRVYNSNICSIIDKLYQGLCKKLDIPTPNVFKLVPFEGSKKKPVRDQYRTESVIENALHGWSMFGLYIVLEKSMNSPHQFETTLDLYLKIDSGKVFFRFYEQGSPIEISETPTDEDINKIITLLEKIFESSLLNNLENWLES